MSHCPFTLSEGSHCLLETHHKKEGIEHMHLLIRRKAGLRWLALLFIGSCFACLFWPGQVSAATGTIADDAQVLNTAAIRQYTDPFSYTVDIFTTTIFKGSNSDFDASVKGLTSNTTGTGSGTYCDPTQQVGCELFSTQTVPGSTYPGGFNIPSTSFLVRNGDADQSVEIGVDVSTRHLAIYAGSGVTIPQSHYNNAIQVFAATMQRTHDNYTQATMDALNALQSASDRFWNGVRAGLPWIVLAVLIVGSLIVSLVMRANGLGGSSRSYGWRNSNTWSSGGNSGGNGNSGGGGGGGASGNF
jgi:hypothetical protein